MRISVIPEGEVHIIGIVGSLDSATSRQFDNEVTNVIDLGAQKILFDFSRLTYISSAGLRVVLSATKRLRSPGCRFGIYGLDSNVRLIFSLSGFHNIVSIYETKDEAIAAMK
jgi:anti-anti-sigma factor